LYFFPEPQGQGSFRPTFGCARTTVAFSGRALFEGPAGLDGPLFCGACPPKAVTVLWLAA
jgi:hypothetical protein